MKLFKRRSRLDVRKYSDKVVDSCNHPSEQCVNWSTLDNFKTHSFCTNYYCEYIQDLGGRCYDDFACAHSCHYWLPIGGANLAVVHGPWARDALTIWVIYGTKTLMNSRTKNVETHWATITRQSWRTSVCHCRRADSEEWKPAVDAAPVSVSFRLVSVEARFEDVSDVICGTGSILVDSRKGGNGKNGNG